MTSEDQRLCENCNDPIEENQKFCEKCGAEVKSVKKAPIKDETISLTSSPSQVPLKNSSIKVGLFDLSRNYYILKENYWDFGSGSIYDENSQEIGKMHRILLSII